MARKKGSAQGNLEDDAEPPKGCHHYQNRQDVPWDIQKYFDQRYSVFSEYDQGIWMTDDAWFGVTPEPVANRIAEHFAVAAPASKEVLIDVFGGAGGNSIAFARSGRWKQVHAIERDAATLACAKHNAKVYGVEDLITWYHGDCFDILANELQNVVRDAVLFASPPWGGPGYRTDQIFDLSQMQPYNLSDLLTPFKKATRDVALYLPRSSDLQQLAACHGNRSKLTVTHYCMEGASKALCAYFGDFNFKDFQDNAMES